MKHCYSTFELPSRIISDRDTHFTSKFWTMLIRLLNVKLGITMAYHPQGDGQSENQTVEMALRRFLGGDVDRYARSISPLFEGGFFMRTLMYSYTVGVT